MAREERPEGFHPMISVLTVRELAIGLRIVLRREAEEVDRGQGREEIEETGVSEEMIELIEATEETETIETEVIAGIIEMEEVIVI